jgi:CubicO group peptidase (beta-lactamase class C family)
MTEDTNFWAASITKSLFATWRMQLVEQQRIDLDKPIAQMLLRPLNEYESYGDSASELVKDPRWQHVKVRMLLDHTSGLASTQK